MLETSIFHQNQKPNESMWNFIPWSALIIFAGLYFKYSPIHSVLTLTIMSTVNGRT